MNNPAENIKTVKFSAKDKLRAVTLVYCCGRTVSEVCARLNITRQTWYNWEKQLKSVLQPIWGGLGKTKQKDSIIL